MIVNRMLGIIVLVFLVQLSVSGFTEIFFFNPSAFNPYMYVTSIFLHGGITHLFFNCFALFLFGSILEKRVGKDEFLTIFFASGIVGGMLYHLTILLGIIPPTAALGASGAVYGILGFLSVIMPRLVVYMGFVPMRIRHAAVLWVVLEFVGAFDVGSGVGSAAHLGGLLFGIAYGYYYKRNEENAAFAEYKWD
ncbi:MAG: rhomboid family intramembrane serine protease [Candidatus Micrarchaeota archaeon]